MFLFPKEHPDDVWREYVAAYHEACVAAAWAIWASMLANEGQPDRISGLLGWKLERRIHV